MNPETPLNESDEGKETAASSEDAMIKAEEARKKAATEQEAIEALEEIEAAVAAAAHAAPVPLSSEGKVAQSSSATVAEDDTTNNI